MDLLRLLLLSALLTLPALAGCLGDDEDPDGGGGTGPTMQGEVTDVTERVDLPFNVSDRWSHVLDAGPYEILPALSIDVLYGLAPEEGGAALDPVDPPRVNMGLFLPDVPEGTKVPVIADVGPYYEDGDVAADQRGSGRLGEFLIANFVPHGYAVAQVSVSGTGQSNHCMDMMGDAEQASIHAAVEYLGNADFSNGNVGLIGRSYDGSTPWEAAAMGSDHLKTIVPISGLTGIPELMFNNGAPETRTLTFHNVVYGTFAVDSDPQQGEVDPEDRHNLCPDYLTATAHQTSEVGAQGEAGYTPYFAERRFFDRALENYDGSVYLIHGLQDWNVDPHAAMPYYPQMQERWETKGLFGQWDHAYPDRPTDHSDQGPGRGQEAFPLTVRYDWAQDLLEWFDHYLKGTGDKPALQVEVQDNMGNWRVEADWPPTSAEERTVAFADAQGPATVEVGGPGSQPVEYIFPPLSEEEDLILTGIPLLRATVTVQEPRGQLFIGLYDAETDLRLGHGVMDLRYHEGDDEPDDLEAGDTVVANLHVEAMEAYLEAGHGLRVVIHDTGEGYTLSRGEAPYTFDASASDIVFRVRAPDEAVFFDPPAWDASEFMEEDA